MGNSIDFANTILKNENKIKGKPKVHHILRKYKKKGSYDILTDISVKERHWYGISYVVHSC